MIRKFFNKVIYAILPGILIAIFLLVGYSTKHFHGLNFSVRYFPLLIIISCAIAFLIQLFYVFFDRLDVKPMNGRSPWINRCLSKSWIYGFLCWSLFIVFWIPSFLAFYPGLFVYDAQWQYFMYVNGEVTNHHPIIHTYLLGFCIDRVHRLTGSINKGIAAYSVVQMILMSLGSSIVMYILHRRKSPMWMHILAFAFFSFNPVYVIFVFSSTKDSLFSVVLAVFVLLTFEIFEDKNYFFKKIWNPILWVIFAFLVANLRNNAKYPLLLVAPFFCIHLYKRKGNNLKLTVMLVLFVVTTLLFQGPITKVYTTGITSKAEMLSVPCQQIMRVNAYHSDELTANQRDTIGRLFDNELWYGYYVPEIADATKGSLRMNEYEKDSSFWDLWQELLLEYPGEYFDAFLENTYAFWYPWPRYIIYSFGGEGYTPIGCMQPGEANSKLPNLLRFYKNFENGPIVQNWESISWLFAPATYMYIALVVAFYLMRDKKVKGLIPMLFIALLWCTFLLGPVAMPRYALYLFVLITAWPVFMFDSK